MAKFLLLTQFLHLSFAVLSLASYSNQSKAGRSSQRAAGVFMLIDGPNYTFNFTAASGACLSLNVTIATMTQMERAVQSGLETCKFGWIDGQIAVVPRITADQKCGKGKTGVVPWRAKPSQMFGVFCFNASAAQDIDTSTPSPQTSSSPASLVSPAQTSPPIPTSPLSAATQAPSSRKPKTTKPRQHLPPTSTTSLLVKATPPPGFASTSPSLKPFAHLTATSPSHLTTSSTAVSAKPSLEAVPMALIVIGIIFLILTVAVGVWYYKLSRRQQKHNIKTEVWKPDTEMELHSEHGEEKEDREGTDRDIMLFVNPNIKPSSE